MPDDCILVSVVVAFPRAADGSFPGLDAITEKTSAAVRGVFANAELWGIDEAQPVVTVKKWRVAYTATLHATPAADGLFQGYAHVGEIVTEVATAPGWIQTPRGWLMSKQVTTV
jgi:hypothetical protein